MKEIFSPVDLYFAKHLLPDGPESAEFFLAYLLKTARDGHLCVEITSEGVAPSLHPEIHSQLISGSEKLPSHLFDKYLVKSGTRFYLKRNWECENRLIFHWNKLKKGKPKLEIVPSWLKEKLEGEKLTPEQKKAILDLSQQSLAFLLGGPGTGKTYTAKVLIKLFLEAHTAASFACAAPTGKATGNLREALQDLSKPITVSTLHSLLKKTRLSEDIILIDEASMIDSVLMSRLFASVKEGARLILLGDPNQLPPVESGNFFADLAEKSEVSLLKTCLRAEMQEITLHAEQAKNGEMIPHLPLPKIGELSDLLLKKEQENFRILTPLRKGIFGVEGINSTLFDYHRKKGIVRYPIQILVNDPFLGLYNGDIGYLDKKQQIAIFGTKEIALHALPRYEYAFAHSIHKSQGSEYENVLILLPPGSEVFGRELLYTALTRAKKKVEVYAETSTLEQILSKKTRRLSGI